MTAPMRIARASGALLLSVLILSGVFSGCLDTRRGHSIFLTLTPVEEERYVEFATTEFDASPATRFLGAALASGQQQIKISDDVALAEDALRSIEAKWVAKYPGEPVQNNVLYKGQVYRVSILFQ